MGCRTVGAVWLAAGLGMVLLLGCALGAREAAPTPRPALALTPAPRATAVVQRGSISETIRFLGRVSAQRQADLAFRTNGTVARVHVQTGQMVMEGEVLAELEPGDLPVRLEQAQVNLQLAQIKLDQARAGAGDTATRRALDLKAAELAVLQAQAQLAKAEEELARARAAPDPVAQAEQAVREAEAKLETARLQRLITQKSEVVARNVREREYEHNWYEVNYGQVLERFRKGEASQRDVDLAWSNLLAAKERLDTARAQAQLALRQADEAVARAEADLARARADLEAARQRPRDAAVKSAELAVQAARLALEKAQAEYEQKKRTPESAADLEIKLLAAQVDQARVAVAEVQEKIAALKLVAPFSGRILSLRLKVGDQVQASQPVITLADPNALEVRTDLTESDLQRVAVGQKVTLTLDTLPGQTLSGTVASVPEGSASDRSIRIAVAWPAETAGKVQVGMLARGTILVREKPDALLIPARAVKTVGNRRFVEYMEGNIRRAQTIEIGIAADEVVEVLRGLREGQVILVGP